MGYRSRKIAVIHKVPSKWLPIRVNKKIVSAKITEKAAVDFIGHTITHSGPLPVTFDTKEVSYGEKWYLRRLEEHQYEYLRDSYQTGAYSFVLIAFWELQKFYVLPFKEIDKRWKEWRSKTGPAFVLAGDPRLIRVSFTGYLDFLIKKDVHGEVTASNKAV